MAAHNAPVQKNHQHHDDGILSLYTVLTAIAVAERAPTAQEGEDLVREVLRRLPEAS